MGLKCSGVAVALAAVVFAGCGSPPEEKGDRAEREQAFRERSTAICDSMVQSLRAEVRRFERGVDDVAGTGDPESLRQEVIGLLDRSGAVLLPYVERSRAVVPPDDPDGWQRVQDRTERDVTRTLDRARAAVNEAPLDDAADVAAFGGRVEDVARGVDAVARETDRVYRRYDVQACLRPALRRAFD